jgi:CRP-like cAMP-binding protein
MGHEMFILIEGEVMIEKQGIELGYLSAAGSFFGENPIIDHRASERRSRSAKAVTDCFLVFLEQEMIIEMQEKYPELKARLIRFRRLGERKKRDVEAAKAALKSTRATKTSPTHNGDSAQLEDVTVSAANGNDAAVEALNERVGQLEGEQPGIPWLLADCLFV